MPRMPDITGQTFNRLTVKEMVYIDRKATECICVCICGKTHTVKAALLKNGSIKSCGCLAKDINTKIQKLIKEKNKIGNITKSFFTAIKWNAKTRNIVFEIDTQYIWDLFVKQNGKCAITNIDIYFGDRDKNDWTASLDRIDNKMGYIKNNIRWVHKVINKMRNNMTDEEFIHWCKLVAEHNK